MLQVCYTGHWMDRLSYVAQPWYPCNSSYTVTFHTSAVKPYGLSGNAAFHFIELIPPFALFCRVLTYSFIHNGMCIVVSGCLVIVIQLETEHVLNKEKLVRLILFSFFFQARYSLPIHLCNVNTEWLCDAPYHGFWADTMSPIIMALH